MHHPKKKAHEKELSRWINWTPNWKNSSYEIPLKIKKIAILIHLIQQPFEGFEKKNIHFMMLSKNLEGDIMIIRLKFHLNFSSIRVLALEGHPT